MIRSALCPVLVQRQDELASLEEALLAAHRGEGRFVVVAGEAGIGKSRLARELSAEARRLGCGVLWGGCSEAEISLPYLPFIEAIGNFLDAEGLDAVAERLGPSRGPLGQLFPQLSGDNAIERAADPAQGKLRLFEAIVSLLALAADERTLLLVIEDVHWADDSTLELLGHLARRLTALPVLVLVTYRSDELHRRHPFMPTLQAWRRSGAAEIVALEPLPAAGVAEMMTSILGTDQVDPGLSELMHRRTDGNPFVLEEMLREAPENMAELGAWRREALDEIGIPETVRDTILLRFARLDRDHAAILEVGAVLGRTFDYATLLAVSQAGEAAVHSALEVAIAQQLIEEDPDDPVRYRWRHALTQEAIYTETVTPRRQAIHARAADVLSEAESTRPVDLAHHLLGAGRFDDAVPVCLRSAEEAERAVAFREAISLLERILPHLHESAEHARVVCRIGQDHWLNAESATGERFLSEGIADLERLDLGREAARFRIVLGRCLWEGAKPDLARAEYRQALDVLSTEGPSADLAMAHMRLAGLDAFELEYESCLDHSRRAVEIAEQAGADFERLWALGFLAVGLLDSGRHERGFEVMDTCFREAAEKGYWFIALNMTWNDVWSRVHLLENGLEARLERFSEAVDVPMNQAGREILGSYVKTARGDLRGAREDAERGLEQYSTLGYEKMAWRCRVQLAEVLTELGRHVEAQAVLPPTSARTELQDVVYDAPAQIRSRLARGAVDEAVALAREILAEAERLGIYRETLAVAAEALVAAGELSDAEALVERGAAHRTGAAPSYLDEMRGRVLVARGDAPGATPLLARAVEAAEHVGYSLVELRRRVLLAHAVGHGGDLETAARDLGAAVGDADRREARLIRAEAEAAARALGIALPPAVEEETEPGRAAAIVPLGERLVTSLFADVRAYSATSATMTPEQLAERIASMYRSARTTIARQGGIIDKFAGDAVMATFNVSGTRVDHCVQALEAALRLHDRAALTGLPLGIGIAVGPAILGRGASEDNLAVTGVSTNLAARLQAEARAGEVLLSEEAHRRVRPWIAEHGLVAERQELRLKGFDTAQVAYRIPAREPVGGEAVR